MALQTKITNNNPQSMPLPWPLAGVLKPSQGIVLNIASAVLLAAVPGLAPALKVDDVAYAGPYDTQYQGSLNSNGTVTITLGETAAFWIDPVNGLDANQGTQSAPFKTWHSGAMPAIAALRNCDVAVTYLGTTNDTSVAATFDAPYVMPNGVRVMVSAPWVDSGQGTITADTGPTTSNLPGVGAAWTANQFAGMRIRFLTGALAGQTYVVRQNTTTALKPDSFGFLVAPTAGDTFVIEKIGCGWAPAATLALDCSNPGAALNFNGFKFACASAGIQIRGNGYATGLEIDAGGTTSQVSFTGGNWRLGMVHGDPFSPDPHGSPNTLGVFVHGGSGAVPTLACGQTFFAQCRNMIFAEAAWNIGGTSNVVVNGLELQGTTTHCFVRAQQGPALVQIQNLNQVGAATTIPCVFKNGCKVDLTTAAFDAAITVDCITLETSDGRFTSCTGGNSGATGKFGLIASNGARVTNGGSNTVVGAGGAIKLGAHAAQATWPAAGTLVTDLGDATPQGCVQF